MYPENTPFPVYCRECWYGDKWDPREYGTEYDFSKPFFTQFKELQDRVPRVALQVDNSVGCEYANQIANCKNCYLISSGSDDEDSMYSFRILNSKNVLDSFIVLRGEFLHECIEGLEVSNLIYTENVASATDLLFCFDARGSQDCFMSSNIWNKKHVFRNKQLTKEEYKEKIKDIDTGSYKNFTNFKEEFQKMRETSIHKYSYMKNNVNSTGNTISYSKNCHHCFNGAELENCRYCIFLNEAKDSMDINNGCCIMELCYEVNTVGAKAFNILFSSDAWPDVRNIAYSDTCRNGSHDLFGCIGMRKKEYCILNKQYTKEEYEDLLPRIKEQMKKVPYKDKKGRIYTYGEFFPIELSPFPYNETPAYDYFPLTKRGAGDEGYAWRDQERAAHAPTIKPGELPDHIQDTDDSILKEIISCAHKGECNGRCTTAFRITPDEFQFYRKMNLPLPRLCPNCRYYSRFKRRNPIKLWHRTCMCTQKEHEHHKDRNCTNTFKTSYAPEKKEKIYCEKCYQSEII